MTCLGLGLSIPSTGYLNGYTRRLHLMSNAKVGDMNFDHDDVVRMITDLQYIRVMKVSGAKQRTAELVRDAVELKSVFEQYPMVRYEPLDYHYVLLKYLAAFNTDVLADLCSGMYSWRGIVIAGWLACLKPSVECMDHLSSVSAINYPDNFWFIRLAIAEAKGQPLAEHAVLQDLLAQLRACLAPISLPDFSLKSAPSPSPVGHDAVRAAYRSGGASAALLALKKVRSDGQLRNDLNTPNSRGKLA